MTIITSHAQALNEINALLIKPPTTQLWPEITRIVGEAVSLPVMPAIGQSIAPLPPVDLNINASEALTLLRTMASIPGQRYIACDWLLALATGRQPAPVALPAMPHAELPAFSAMATASEALDILHREADRPGNRYLPCDWLRTLATFRVTPVQQVADKLLDAAIAYEKNLTAEFICEFNGDGDPTEWAHDTPLAAELVALRELIKPFTPPTLDEALEALRAVVKSDVTFAELENPLALPWQLDEDARSGSYAGCRGIEDCNGVQIAYTVGLADDDEDRAIAEHIIASANCYKAAQRALHRLQELAPHYSGMFRNAIEKDIAALTAAGVKA